MIIKRIINDYIEENTYILIKDDQCLIVDPGSNFLDICNEIKDNRLLKILITHSHHDHTFSLLELVKKYSIDVINFSNSSETIYEEGPFKFKVIFNPGHSRDSISFHFLDEKILFTGDFIFKENIGRCDLPTGNFSDMIKSLEMIKKYDKDIVIYPGHGDKTTIGYELENNIYMK